MKLKDTLKSIKKAAKTESLTDSSYAKVVDYLDTGSYAINRVLTGDIHKGFPVGRISTIYGISQSGKTLIVTQTIINAIKQNKVDVVYIFDSEGGILYDMFKKNLTEDELEKIEHIPVNSVENCSVQMLTVYDTLIKAKQEFLNDPDNNDDIRALCVLDSYGALSADKLVTDAVKKEQMVQDMGLSAKLKNNLMRGLMMRVVQSNATLLVINHEYQDPSAMFTSKVHMMGGGKGIEFASHVILQCEKLMIKSSDTEFLTGLESENENTGFFKGNKLKFFVVKNRLAKPAYTATVFVDFNYGIAKYDGLIEDAVSLGFLTEVRGGYICPSYSEKRITYKELVSNESIWNTFIDEFNRKSIEIMTYSGMNQTSKMIEEIANELNEE